MHYARVDPRVSGGEMLLYSSINNIVSKLQLHFVLTWMISKDRVPV